MTRYEKWEQEWLQNQAQGMKVLSLLGMVKKGNPRQAMAAAKKILERHGVPIPEDSAERQEAVETYMAFLRAELCER